jgi:DNA-binding MarR family transcriptional regulator
MEGSDYRELRMLSEVHSTPGTTQRDLSRQIGIALGLTNVLLRNLVEKGYVRITRASWKRWMYALTPSGFSRKIQLTVAYVHRVLDHYQEVRQTLREELQTVHLNEESRVAIFGTGEFAELVYLGLREMEVEEIDIFSSRETGNGRFLGMSVRDVGTLQPEQYDRIFVARLDNPDAGCMELQELGVAKDKLVTFFTNRDARGEE